MIPSEPRPSILVVEDEADLAELLQYNFAKEGYQCRCVDSGRAAVSEIHRRKPDLIMLDRRLPGESGDEIATRLRHDPRTTAIPIIMLTAKAEESDQLVGFALGVDDYVTKPFSMKVLMARVAALLRRRAASNLGSDTYTAGPIALDHGRREVLVDGREIRLTGTEFGILHALMAAGGRVLDRDQLIDAALGREVAVTDRTIDVHIAALRRKLGNAAPWIQTVRGFGYACRHAS